LFSTAYAQTKAELQGKHEVHSGFRKFWTGVTGINNNNWFVIVGSHLDRADAEAQKQALTEKGYLVKVFEPFVNNKYYGVMLASFVSYDDARNIRRNAIKNGLPIDTYLWQAK